MNFFDPTIPAIWGHFGAILDREALGVPQISVEEDRIDARMVREWSNNVSKVDWSRFGSVWSRMEAVLGRVLAGFGRFWPFLAKILCKVAKCSIVKGLKEPEAFF